MREQCVAIIGCGVMGKNLALNLERNGYPVAAYDADPRKLAVFLEGEASGRRIRTVGSLAEVAAALRSPRVVLLMVPAGEAVDTCLAELTPHLAAGDIVIDGGNSHFVDTARRERTLAETGLHFVGAGISGGEEGALRGPAIMPGGAALAWEHIRPMLQAIAARADDGTPCCDWVGPGGAGHFVKMMHNGIEYADMQIICEAYHLLRAGLGVSLNEIADVFTSWNQTELAGYLVEITAKVLAERDAVGEAIVDQILDTAGQKGTGRWTVATALDLGQPTTTIDAAVFARFLSSLKDERVTASERLAGPSGAIAGDRDEFIDDLRQAAYASRICVYAQAFALLRAADREHGWKLDPGRVASLWRAGCIIRAALLPKIMDAFADEPGLQNLMLSAYFRERLAEAQSGWRNVIREAVRVGIPTPGTSAALAYYDGYRTAVLPANLLQAQRDFFGAHGYERVDRPRGERFHHRWG